jgi:NDP-sugar pyrophosphorylase family protein
MGDEPATGGKSGSKFEDLTVLILVGGQGSRLRSAVSDRPKPMAEVNGRPFLDILVKHASACGLKRFVLCTGYMGDYIRAYYSKTAGPSRISFSREERPLGTAGALKNAEYLIESDPFIVMNGDSFCSVDLRALFEFHKAKRAVASIVVARMNETGDYGNVVVSQTGRIEGYEEKADKKAYVNAGIYCMDTELLAAIPIDIPYSLERDVFPTLCLADSYAYVVSSGFIDIGTPERYLEAKRRCTSEMGG